MADLKGWLNMEEKKEYIVPELNVVTFEQPDVITLSDGGEGPGGNGKLGL